MTSTHSDIHQEQSVPSGPSPISTISVAVAESEESIDYRMERSEAPPRPLPPHNDYGTLEDSLANCKNLVPKKPKGDFVKFYEKDR